MEPEIEPATREDVDRLASLWVDLATDQRAHGSHILPATNRPRIRQSLLHHQVDDRVLVARGDDVLGFVMFTIEQHPYERDVSRGLVENLFVVPEARDRGVGSALLRAAEAVLADRGVDAVALEVLADNEGARRFYRRAGYDPARIQLERTPRSDTHSKDDG